MRVILLLSMAAAAAAQSRESIEAQRRSVTLQRETLARSRGPQPGVAPEALPLPTECDPLPGEKLIPMIESAAKAHALPVKLIQAVLAQSGGRPCAVSRRGGKGLMQLMPEHADLADPFEPEPNLQAGARLLRQLLEKFKGDLPLALAAYHGAATGIPEVREHIDAIVARVGLKRIDLPSTPKPKPIEN